jgi:hypothetical protein
LKFALGRRRPVGSLCRSSPPSSSSSEVASALGGVIRTYEGGIKPRYVAFSTKRVAVKGEEPSARRAVGALDEGATIEPIRSPFDRVARPEFHFVPYQEKTSNLDRFRSPFDRNARSQS